MANSEHHLMQPRRMRETLMFLEPTELVILTGRRMKGHQIVALRQMGIPFHVNATGHPVVTRAAIEGRKDTDIVKPVWVPQVLKKAG